jgi:hypothetical protein
MRDNSGRKSDGMSTTAAIIGGLAALTVGLYIDDKRQSRLRREEQRSPSTRPVETRELFDGHNFDVRSSRNTRPKSWSGQSNHFSDIEP